MDLETLRHNERVQRYIATMRPVFNRRALYSDTTEDYVTPAEPSPYDMVTIRFRTGKNNVDRVFVVHNGERELMSKEETRGDFDFYICKLQLDNEKVAYYFEVHTGRIVGFYDVRGLVQEVNEYYCRDSRLPSGRKVQLCTRYMWIVSVTAIPPMMCRPMNIAISGSRCTGWKTGTELRRRWM